MKRFTYFLSIFFLSVNSFAQGHFIVAFSGNGQDHMNIFVVTATIGGVDLEAGDEIAVFDGTICCGKVILTKPIVLNNNSTFGTIAASRKDEGQSNGYTEGNAITYKFWDSSKTKEISGITAEYLDVVTGLPITAPTYSINGTAIVKLAIAAPVNHTPISNAGQDQSLNEGTTATLDGTGSSDPDSDPFTYKWIAQAGITLSSGIVAKPTFTAPEVTADKTYTFSLVVNDGTIDSPADQVIITVKNVDKAPYVKDPIKNISVNKRTLDVIIDLKTVFADDDIGDVLIYSVTSNTNSLVVLANTSGSQLTLSFSTVNVGTSDIEITASSNGKEAKSQFKVDVNIPTGINPMISDQKMILYPNPTSGKVKVIFERIPQSENYLTVLDLSGMMLLKKLIRNKDELIDLSGNPSGVYLMHTNLNLKVQKIILK